MRTPFVFEKNSNAFCGSFLALCQFGTLLFGFRNEIGTARTRTFTCTQNTPLFPSTQNNIVQLLCPTKCCEFFKKKINLDAPPNLAASTTLTRAQKNNKQNTKQEKQTNKTASKIQIKNKRKRRNSSPPLFPIFYFLSSNENRRMMCCCVFV